MRKPLCTLLTALLVSPIAIAAAQQTNYVTGATVTGHVFCADTNAPARFARVALRSATPSSFGNDFIKNIEKQMAKSAKEEGEDAPKPLTDQQKHSMAAATRGLNRATDLLNSSTVGLDGSFSFSNVKPGTYYVHAIYAGYIDPLAGISDGDFTSTDPAVHARIAQLPTVTIEGTESARIDLRLDRGAAISGRILYQDGTPAPGWSISVVNTKETDDGSGAAEAAMTQALAITSGMPLFKTDDRGNFRISGLLPSDYAIRAMLTATPVGISGTNIADGGSGINLTVYSGDTFSRADAKALHLNVDDELSGIVINVPSGKLHNIVGHVYSNADGHALNGGSVALSRKDSPGIAGSAAIRDDGSFHFDYLPPGKYTITISQAADVRHKPAKSSFMGLNIPDTETLKKYATATTDVLLADSDIDNVRLSVAPTKWVPSPDKPTVTSKPGDVLNDLFTAEPDEEPQAVMQPAQQ